MDQYQLAEIFDRISALLEIKGEVVYKRLAYKRAADSLRDLNADLQQLHAENRLEEIPGVGKAIAEKIAELLDTGHLRFLEKLEAEIPPSLVELLSIPEVGPKKALLFYKEAGVTSLAELEAAAREGKLSQLPGIGPRTEARILANIEAHTRRSVRMPLREARIAGERWLRWLRGLPGVQQADLAGSIRRWRSTIGDIDLVAASADPKPVMEAFVNHPEVKLVNDHGEYKSSVLLNSGISVQLWVQPPERYGTLLFHGTGSKDHNVRLRELAQQRGLSLSERGLVDKEGREQLFADEEQLYKAFDLPWIPPELRENRGEFEAARNGRLPELIRLEDLTAELHSHSNWSDGSLPILKMAQAALERGLRVLAITDHSQSLGVANGLSPERLRAQRKEIDAAQAELGDSILLLQGVEMEIRADGMLDLDDDTLAGLDIVIASLHVGLRQPREEVTRRMLTAIRNPHVDLIAHPSGRLLGRRDGADLDWDAVLAAAKEHGVALEINAHPDRLDLDDIYAHRAAEMGIPIAINTDAHSPADMDLREYGVYIARRAWLGPAQVINTWPAERLLRWLRERQPS